MARADRTLSATSPQKFYQNNIMVLIQRCALNCLIGTTDDVQENHHTDSVEEG